MSTVTENDLKELKELINSRFDSLERGQSEIKERLAVVETRLEDWKPSVYKIPDLAEKVGELKNWRQIVIIALTALISGSITWVIRGGSMKP